MQPAFESCDGVGEVVVARQQQIDVVEVLPASEAVGEVVARDTSNSVPLGIQYRSIGLYLLWYGGRYANSTTTRC